MTTHKTPAGLVGAINAKIAELARGIIKDSTNLDSEYEIVSNLLRQFNNFPNNPEVTEAANRLTEEWENAVCYY